MEYRKSTCTGCLQPITGKEFLRCYHCSSRYDLICANVSPRSFNCMKQPLRDGWKCQGYKNMERKVDNSNTPIRSVPQQVEYPDRENVTVRKPAATASASTVLPLDSAEEIGLTKESLRALIKEEVGKAVAESVGHIVKEQLKSINETLGGFHTSFSSIDAQLENLKSALEEKTKTINVLKKENGKLKECIHRLEENINDSEQLSLSNDVDIVGVPEATGEAVVHVVLTLARKLGVSLTENDVVSADRVGAAREESSSSGRVRARPIAVRLARRALREDMLRAARVRRGVTTADAGLTSGDSRRFYVNERLTKKNRSLFLKAREIGARLKWRFVWSKDGRVYARQHQSETSPRHRLRTEADLERVFGTDVVGSSDKNESV